MSAPILPRRAVLHSRRTTINLPLRSAFSSSSRTRKELRDAYILSGSRTPTGIFNGAFINVPAPQLGATAIKSALSKSGVSISSIEHVYMGNVMQAHVGQAPARQASIFAGLPNTVEATTINKVCASGLKAVTIGAADIATGAADVVVAGGMENMTRVPYYLPRASQLPAFGDTKLVDGLVSDGLWDVYNQIHMGVCADKCAAKHSISRESQDAYAIESYRRAQDAWSAGHFTDEVAPVTLPAKKKTEPPTTVTHDEGYTRLKPDKVSTLKPAFVRDASGTVTAANSSSFNDGASALVLASPTLAKHHGASSRVLARIIASADAALDPLDFPTAPAAAIPKLLARAKDNGYALSKADVSVWEFNEAFAAVIRANAKILGLGEDNVNPRGGAIALGHALGSSGSRILVTLLHQLEVGAFGVAAICNGGGAATAVLVQRVAVEDVR